MAQEAGYQIIPLELQLNLNCRLSDHPFGLFLAMAMPAQSHSGALRAHSTVCWQLAQSEVYLFTTNGSLPTLSLLEGTMSPQSQGTLALFGPVESTGESGTLAEIGSSMWQE